MAHDDDRIATLVRAWQTSGGGSICFSQQCSTAHKRPSCGCCTISLLGWTREDKDPIVAARRLGELVRLLAVAMRGGPNVFRAMDAYSSVCPYTPCAWCDEADSKIEISLGVLDARASEPAILHDALFQWSETAASDEFKALRDAFEGVALCPIGVSSDQIVVNRLLHAMASNDAPIEGIRLQQLAFDGTLLESTPVSWLLHHPFALSLKSPYQSAAGIDTLLSVCSTVADASLAHVTRMALVLDQESLNDTSTMREFCTFASTQWLRLEELSLMGCPDAGNENHRHAVKMLCTAVSAAPRLLALAIEGPSMEQLVNHEATDPLAAQKLSIHSAAMAVLSVGSLERLTVRGEWHVTALRRFLSSCPTLRELSIHRLLADDDVIARESSAETTKWPSLTKLSVTFGWHRDLLTVLMRSGMTLTSVTLTASLGADGVAVVETLALHCPSVARLSVSDIDVAFVDALVAARDNDRLRRLRELFIDARAQSIAATACVHLLQILSDARRRLTRSLQALDIVAPRDEYPCVRLAMDLMLRCNATIVRATLVDSGNGRVAADQEEPVDDDDDVGPCFDFYESDLEQSDDDEADAMEADDVMAACEDDATRRTLHAMLAAAEGKTAIPHHAVLPDAVVLPSLSRCVALLSAFAAHDARLPVPLVQHILMMAGRRPLRVTC